MPRYSLALLLLLLACGTDRSGDGASRDSTGAAASATAAGQTQRGEFVDGDERSNWMRTTLRDGGISIEDDARFGEDGQANRVFTFDASGKLLRATDQRTQTAQGAGNQSPMPVRTELIVDFTGTAPVATKMVDDIRRPVEPYEIDNIRRRADALLAQSRRTLPRTSPR
jgi:hypothetical protein